MKYAVCGVGDVVLRQDSALFKVGDYVARLEVRTERLADIGEVQVGFDFRRARGRHRQVCGLDLHRFYLVELASARERQSKARHKRNSALFVVDRVRRVAALLEKVAVVDDIHPVRRLLNVAPVEQEECQEVVRPEDGVCADSEEAETSRLERDGAVERHERIVALERRVRGKENARLVDVFVEVAVLVFGHRNGHSGDSFDDASAPVIARVCD